MTINCVEYNIIKLKLLKSLKKEISGIVKQAKNYIYIMIWTFF